MRRRIIGSLWLLVALGVPAYSFGSAAHPHEPAGYIAIGELNFSTLNGGGFVTAYNELGTCTIIQDGAAPTSPPNVSQDIWNQSLDVGACEHYIDPLPGNTYEAYAHATWKISNPFVPYASCFEKIFKFDHAPGGISGAIWAMLDGCPGEGIVRFNIGLGMNTPGNELGNCQTPYRHQENCTNDPNFLGTINAFSDVVVTQGVWHSLELWVKVASCPQPETCQQSKVYVWLDNVQIMKIDNANMYNQPWIHFLIGPAWSPGAGPGPKAHFWDHIYVSGLTGTGSPQNTTPPPPPPAPTGLRIL